jgi:hypothetical protein
MRQTFHIFKKDVRSVRWEIALVVLLVAAFAYTQTPDHQMPDIDLPLLNLLVPLSWIYLIGRIIHAEALAGSKQFWLTRPYSKKSLFAAKMLLLLAFVTLPITISDVVIVKANGFAPWHYLPGLLWEQVIRWMVLVAPAMALAAVTTDVAQQAFSILIGLLFLFGLTEWGFHSWGDVEWVRASIGSGLAGLGAAAIVVSQYALRKTAVARLASAALVGLGGLILLLPGPKDRYVRSSALSATVDVSMPWETGNPRKWPYVPQAALPLRLTGLRNGVTPSLDDGQVTIPGYPNAVGVADWEVVDASHVWELIIANRPVFDEIKNTPVRVHTFVDLTLVRNKVTTPLSHTGSTMVPGVGLCSAVLSCVSPFRTPRVLVFDNWTGAQPEFTSGSPFPAEFGISPIVTLQPHESRAAALVGKVTTAEPVEQRRFDFDLDNVRLADFEFHP